MSNKCEFEVPHCLEKVKVGQHISERIHKLNVFRFWVKKGCLS